MWGKGALEKGQSEGTLEGNYGQKGIFSPKKTVKTGKCCKKKRVVREDYGQKDRFPSKKTVKTGKSCKDLKKS